MKQLNVLKLALGSCAVIFSQLSYADFVSGIPAGYVCTGTCGTAAADGDVTLSL